MEGAGLAIGIASLYTFCLTVLEQVEDYKGFGTYSRQLVARFEACKLRLQEWAEGAGISHGDLAAEHHVRLDNPDVARVIRGILESVCETFEQTEYAKARLRLPTHQGSSYPLPKTSQNGKRSDRAKSGSQSKLYGVVWAIKGKRQFSEQVGGLEMLVNDLYDIVPLSDNGRQLQRTDSQAFEGNRGSWTLDSSSLFDICIASAQSSKALEDYQHDLMIRLENMRRNIVHQTYKQIDEWLDTSRLDKQYEKHLSDHLEGTCDWIFNHAAYREWVSTKFLDDAAKFLWICGPAGHGKSVLCAQIFLNLHHSDENSGAYFSATDHVQAGGHPDEVIRFWLSQLAKSDRVAFDVIWDTLQSTEASRSASRGDIWTTFEKVISSVDNCFLLLDGYDEYDPLDGRRSEFLRRLKKAVAGTKTRCLITSRIEADIELELCEHASRAGEQRMLECKVTYKEIQADIQLYSEKMVIERLPKKEKLLQEELASEMAAKCQGMFLWIKLHQGQLRGGKGQKELRNIVKSMPQGLHQSYDRNWSSIQSLPDHDRHRAISILRWITFSHRPLTVGELTEALTVELDTEGEGLPVDDMPDEIDDDYVDDEIRLLCRSLIEVRSSNNKNLPSSRTVHLVHVSVKEFLVSALPIPSTYDLSPAEALQYDLQNDHLAKVCLQYINFEEVWQHQKESNNALSGHFFLRYAASSWFQHLNLSKIHAKTHDLINEFFALNNSAFSCWAENFEMDESKESHALEDFSQANMYFASRFGLTRTMEYLQSQRSTNVDLVGHQYGTALQAACAMGHQEAFNLLLGWGADVNKKGGEYGSAINAAAAKGEEIMVIRLLKSKASLGIPDESGRTPLHLACRNGKEKVVRILVDAGASLTALTGASNGAFPLHSAAYAGHVEIAKILIEKGADVSAANENDWTPLHSAVHQGRVEILKLLISHGASLSKFSKDGWSPMQLAAYEGHAEIMRILLDKGVDPTTFNKDTGTPVQLAIQQGHIELMRLLLDNGVDPSSSTDEGWTLLHTAAAEGNIEKMKVLIEKRATVWSFDEDRWTPLHSAAENGHIQAVKLLLESEAESLAIHKDAELPLHATAKHDLAKLREMVAQKRSCISISDELGFTPLHVAAQNNHAQIVKLLLDTGVDDSIPTKAGRTPLFQAANRGHVEVVKLLLQQTVAISVPDEDGHTPLSCSVFQGHLEIVRLLLDVGADMSISTEKGWTPLNTALFKGHVEIAKLLLDRGADYSIASKNGWTPFNSALYGGQVEIAKLLLEKGADPSIAPSDGWTPLYSALVSGHTEIAKLLLDTGADFSTPTKDGWMPLHMTVFYNQVGTTQLLLEKGVDPSVSLEDGRTSLHLATYKGNVEIINMLLEKGAVSSSDEDGWMPLHSAAKHGQTRAVKTLLDGGLDTLPPLKDGRTLLHLAVVSGEIEVVDLLLTTGADPSASTLEEWTPLHYAAHLGHAKVVKLLLEKGADISRCDSSRSTALHRAVYHGHEDCVDVLIEGGADLSLLDIYGRTSLDWIAILKLKFKKSHRLSTQRLEDRKKRDNDATLKTSIHEIVRDLLKREGSHCNSVFETIARCFKYLNMLSDAVLAFQLRQQITESGDYKMLVYNHIDCDACGDCILKDMRWVCRICPDIDLCDQCISDRPLKKKPSPACQDHEFLKVPKPDSADNLGSIKQWINKELSRWSKLDLSPDQGSEAAENIIKRNSEQVTMVVSAS